jgi:predicted ATP-grasp superfamily ATP-dependent carboligase
MVVGLGAFPAPAPHTRPVRLVATAPPTSAELIDRVGRTRGELEVPAGMTAALEVAFGAAGIDMVSLWARVPHYVAAMTFPEASAALVDGLAAVAGLSFDSSELHRAADASKRQVDEVIANNREHVAMVKRLEESVDAAEGNPLTMGTLPSGDELAAELEQFLRGEDH